MKGYDLLGDIAIIKSDNRTLKDMKKQAKEILKQKSIKTVIAKSSDVKGRLRTIKTKHIVGKKNLIAEYKENNCRFKFNVETCYFSPRLSGERKLITKKIKSKDRVLVMFAGVGVYPIVIYKIKKPKKIISIELGRDCCKYFKENLKLNKIPEKSIEILQGDVKRKINQDFIKHQGKFDVVIMARPNLKETFLKSGLKACKKNSLLIYYGFCNVDEINNMIENLKKEAEFYKRKIKLIKKIKSGDIAPYKFRYRLEFKVVK